MSDDYKTWIATDHDDDELCVYTHGPDTIADPTVYLSVSDGNAESVAETALPPAVARRVAAALLDAADSEDRIRRPHMTPPVILRPADPRDTP